MMAITTNNSINVNAERRCMGKLFMRDPTGKRGGGATAPVVTQLEANPWQRPADTPPQRTDFLSLASAPEVCWEHDWPEAGFGLVVQQELRAFLAQCWQPGVSCVPSQQQPEDVFS